jgi:glycosyltransferase involved in cell wall biosynthesis
VEVDGPATGGGTTVQPPPSRDIVDSPRVSVVIPAYNEERNIGRLIEFILSHPLRRGRISEILVETSGSTDGTAAVVHSLSAQWAVVRDLGGTERLGLFAAFQRLLATATGDMILRVDADVRLEESTLDRLTDALETPGVGMCGPRVRPIPGPSRWVNRAVEAEWAIHHAVSRRSPKVTLVQAFRRLTASLPEGAALEDVALQAAVERSGYRVVYVPDCAVLVSSPATVRALMAQRVRTIRIIRFYLDQGHERPPTDSLTLLGAAVLEVMAGRESRILDLGLFTVLETFCRIASRFGSTRGPATSPHWDAAEGTKEPSWSSSTGEHRR